MTTALALSLAAATDLRIIQAPPERAAITEQARSTNPTREEAGR